MQSVSIFTFLLRQSSSGLTQALVHTHFIPAQFSVTRYLPSCRGERPGSSAAFPSGTFTPLPSALTSALIPTAGSCPGQPAFVSPAPRADTCSVRSQSHQPFGALGELLLPLGFGGQTGDALSRAAPASRPELGVLGLLGFFSSSARTQDYTFTCYKSHQPFLED